jgi:hypothetical protein
MILVRAKIGSAPRDKDEESINGPQESHNELLWTKIAAQAYLACTQAILRNTQEYSPSGYAYSPIAQVRAAAAQVQRRKWKIT